MSAIRGIHHVTAIASDPQRNLDFYAGILGLRFIKRTVNFDDPGTYHFYYGDQTGAPGTILTFFPWPGAPRGRHGTGQLTVTSLSIPTSAMAWWIERLKANGIETEGPYTRFGEEVLEFTDHDGLKLELVGHSGADVIAAMEGGPIPADKSIRGFFGVTLSEEGYQKTAELLSRHMGFTEGASFGNRFRYTIGDSQVDVLCQPDSPPGTIAAGTVHHVAWRVEDDASQLAWRARLVNQGYNVTPVMDRQYFHSIYYREPGGIIFEIATDPPGFLIDESVEELGGHLKLPPWLERRREIIEQTVPPIQPPQWP